LIFAELNGGLYFGANRVGKDRRQNEMIASHKDTGRLPFSVWRLAFGAWRFHAI
jgi:hypothetical protein